MTMMMTFLVAGASAVKSPAPYSRPQHVIDHLASNQPLYYFGLGSNMLRSKLENRGINGSKIELLEMKPAVVPGYRLAFNLRGFLPLEPGMGSLEPVHATSRPLVLYEQPECHGALVKLTPDNYEKVMRSEGVGHNATGGGYQEIVVDAYPYHSRQPVKAVALRARRHVRLRRDPCPSARYMNILKEGAAELGLIPSYQAFLNSIPVHSVPQWSRGIALHNFLFLLTVSSTMRTRILSRLQSWVLFRLYVPSNSQRLTLWLSQALSAAVILPGAVLGRLVASYHRLTGKAFPPFYERMVHLLRTEDPVIGAATSTSVVTSTKTGSSGS